MSFGRLLGWVPGYTLGWSRKFAEDDSRMTATAQGKLRSFAQKVVDAHRDGDVDMGDVQDWALDAGLLERIEVTEPCGDRCACAEEGDFPLTCLRSTALLLGPE